MAAYGVYGWSKQQRRIDKKDHLEIERLELEIGSLRPTKEEQDARLEANLEDAIEEEMTAAGQAGIAGGSSFGAGKDTGSCGHDTTGNGENRPVGPSREIRMSNLLRQLEQTEKIFVSKLEMAYGGKTRRTWTQNKNSKWRGPGGRRPGGRSVHSTRVPI